MKKYFYTPVLVVLLTSLMTVRAQDRNDYLGLPGDNLNLFAVMKVFQESETLESFERELNDQNSLINNLDLNGDGYVDYIRVIDNVDRSVHFIILQVAINSRENQDVAVFTVVQESNGQVSIQLVGDEALYGKNYIVEPIFDETPNPGYMGNARKSQRVNVVRTTTYEIAAWPVIRFMFTPTYVIWHSPWRWDYYPSYWSPWNSHYWHYYYGYHQNYYSYYYGHYRHWNHHRNDYWHNNYYTQHHHYSPYVRTRINDGYYKRTYSKPESRSQGTAYYKTRQAERTRSGGVSTSEGRRTSSGSVSNSGSGTRNSAGSGRTTTRTSRDTDTRKSTGTGTGTRTSTNTNSRQSSGSATRQSTGTGNREATSGSNETRSSSTGNNRSTTTTTRQTNTSREPSGTSSEKRSPANTSRSDRGSSSVKSDAGSNRQSKSTSTSSSGRRSDTGSGSQTKSSDKSENSKTTRNSGRR